MHYTCRHFEIAELVPKREAQNVPEPILWQFFNQVGLITIDLIQERVGSIYINNWSTGGALQFCGWRPFTCAEGAQWSGHKFGQCFDLHPAKMSGPELIADIIKNPDIPAYKYITEVEVDNVNRAHVSFRNWQRDKYGIRKIIIP